MSNNVNSIGPSKVAKIFAPLVIGSALAFGGKVNAAETEKPLPEASQATVVQVEKPALETPKIVKSEAENKTDSFLDFRLPLGYVLGATMGHILQRRRDNEEINTLEREAEHLKKLQKIVK